MMQRPMYRRRPPAMPYVAHRGCLNQAEAPSAGLPAQGRGLSGTPTPDAPADLEPPAELDQATGAVVPGGDPSTGQGPDHAMRVGVEGTDPSTAVGFDQWSLAVPGEAGAPGGLGQPEQATRTAIAAMQARDGRSARCAEQGHRGREHGLRASGKTPTKRVGKGKSGFSVEEAQALERALTDQWWGVRDPVGEDRGLPSSAAQPCRGSGGGGFRRYSGGRPSGEVPVEDHRGTWEASRGHVPVSALTAALSVTLDEGEGEASKSDVPQLPVSPSPLYVPPACPLRTPVDSEDIVRAAESLPKVVLGSNPEETYYSPAGLSPRIGCKPSAPISVPAVGSGAGTLGEQHCEEPLELPVSFQATPGSPKLYVPREARRMPSLGRASMAVPLVQSHAQVRSPAGGSLPSSIPACGPVRPVAANADPLGAVSRSLQEWQGTEAPGDPVVPQEEVEGGLPQATCLSPLGSLSSLTPRQSSRKGRAWAWREAVGPGSKPANVVGGYSAPVFRRSLDGPVNAPGPERELRALRKATSTSEAREPLAGPSFEDESVFERTSDDADLDAEVAGVGGTPKRLDPSASPHDTTSVVEQLPTASAAAMEQGGAVLQQEQHVHAPAQKLSQIGYAMPSPGFEPATPVGYSDKGGLHAQLHATQSPSIGDQCKRDPPAQPPSGVFAEGGSKATATHCDVNTAAATDSPRSQHDRGHLVEGPETSSGTAALEDPPERPTGYWLPRLPSAPGPAPGRGAKATEEVPVPETVEGPAEPKGLAGLAVRAVQPGWLPLWPSNRALGSLPEPEPPVAQAAARLNMPGAPSQCAEGCTAQGTAQVCREKAPSGSGWFPAWASAGGAARSSTSGAVASSDGAPGGHSQGTGTAASCGELMPGVPGSEGVSGPAEEPASGAVEFGACGVVPHVPHRGLAAPSPQCLAAAAAGTCGGRTEVSAETPPAGSERGACPVVQGAARQYKRRILQYKGLVLLC
eukprot:jgi/Botrbrau1/3036/Bobra.0070s0032.1